MKVPISDRACGLIPDWKGGTPVLCNGTVECGYRCHEPMCLGHSWAISCSLHLTDDTADSRNALVPCYRAVSTVYSHGHTHLLPIPLPDGSHVYVSVCLSVRLRAVTWNMFVWTQLVSYLCF